MKGNVLKTSAAAALAFTMFSGLQTPVANAAGDFTLTIMHTNDTHANLKDIAKRVTLESNSYGES
jgi:5'-nucleotidase/UDP-sugar diphosphatase